MRQELSLDGAWRFRWVPKPADRPTRFFEPTADVSDWAEIQDANGQPIKGFRLNEAFDISAKLRIVFCGSNSGIAFSRSPDDSLGNCRRGDAQIPRDCGPRRRPLRLNRPQHAALIQFAQQARLQRGSIHGAGNAAGRRRVVSCQDSRARRFVKSFN